MFRATVKKAATRASRPKSAPSAEKNTGKLQSADRSAPEPLYNWLRTRSAGILLHPTALPGTQGVGVFDRNAVAFLDFLKGAGVASWQLCPLGPTGYGDSPYQCFSAFAGNPYLIDLEALVQAGLLQDAELAPLRRLPEGRVDYGAMFNVKWPLLFAAHRHWVERKRPALPYGDFNEFREAQSDWLDDYAYYRALKDRFDGAAWQQWPDDLRVHARAQSHPLRSQLADAIEAQVFTQYLFFGQWAQIRAAAQERGISIIGDLPIFVASDSADAWAAPQLFEFDHRMQPIAVAGVPPDYFSADGQLWGNPLYRWEAHRAEGYAWWLARLRSSFELYDIVRIDHFRGFDTYWRIPTPAENARKGEWVNGPGLDLFRVIRDEMPDARIIAEDLGELSESVRDLLRDTGLPGMLVLQFAFGGDAKNGYLPHQATPNSVIYPGTHDNDTTVGWYRAAPEHVRDHMRRYFQVSGENAAWDFVRAAYASVSRLAIVSLQDVLQLDTSARFNTPARAEGNWQWRCTRAQLAELSRAPQQFLRDLAAFYDR
jgi:4-alpha-glucanotransferase